MDNHVDTKPREVKLRNQSDSWPYWKEKANYVST